MGLEGKIAVVTGASRGIGKAIALELGAQGARVIGTATTPQGAEHISGYLADKGLQGQGKCLDAASPASVESFRQSLEADAGAAQILVNNAGIAQDSLLMRLREEDWERVLNTNLSSVYRMSKALLRGMMKARWGRIISLSSVVASSGNIGQAHYSASKAGIEGFTRTLAMEIGSRGITVNAVAPGFIDTDMTRAMGEEQAAALLARIPLGRYGSPAEVAAVAGFLASDEAAYITGETIHVNGGMYMA